MNTNSNSNTSGNSNILHLQRLIKQYNNTLTEYQQMYQSYLSSLSSSVSKNGLNSNKKFISVPNSAFWGTAGIAQQRVLTDAQCSNLCKAKSSCSGATFDSGNKFCWLRSGQGSTIPSTSNQIAIIPTSQKYMGILKSLNEKLTDINNQIIKITKNKILTNIETQGQISSKTLQDNYNQLLKDRKMIQDINAEQQNLIEEVNDTDLIITHSYTYYLFILLLFVFILYLFLRFVIFSTGSSEKNESMIGGSYSFSKMFKKHLPFLFRK
jgi:hypothetical protein